ncbi:MAG: hypothetical protein ABIL09_14595 [Gemmatimonadota bacterium]
MTRAVESRGGGPSPVAARLGRHPSLAASGCSPHAPGGQLFDLDSPMAAILAEGGLCLSDAVVDSFGREFDAGEANLLVHGDLPRGALVRGRRSVLVDGDVLGQPDAPCRLEIDGEVVVTGSVEHSHVVARRVSIGGQVRCSQLTAGEHIQVRGDAERCRFLCGDYAADLGEARRRQFALAEARTATEELRRRVAVEERRLHKACAAMRSPVDLNVGRIVAQSEERVVVDLGTFYRSCDWKTEEDLSRALDEFFAKGVVGVLARLNRRYLLEVPTRGRVFMQLLRDLHDLLVLVMRADARERAAVRRELDLERLVVEMESRSPLVAVGGTVAPSIRVEFILPRVIRQADGGIDFAHKTAQLAVHAGTFADKLELVSQGADGQRAERVAPAADLEGLVFQVCDEQVRWDRLVPA